MHLARYLLLAVVIAMNVSACGTKGKLKTPTQIEKDDARKARQKIKKEKEQQQEKENDDDADNSLQPDAITLPATANPATDKVAP